MSLPRRILVPAIALATAACAASAPPSPGAPASAAAPPAVAKSVERRWDDSRIEALLAYHARVTGYRTMCWETRARRSVRCYDI